MHEKREDYNMKNEKIILIQKNYYLMRNNYKLRKKKSKMTNLQNHIIHLYKLILLEELFLN